MSHVTECYHSKCRIHSMRSDTKYSTSSFLTSNWTAREVYNLRQFQVGLYFYLRTSLNVTHVTVLDSNATGLVIYDTGGYVSIVDSVFQNNNVHVSAPFSEAGGGGVYVEFSYCAPGVTCDGNSLVCTDNANSVYAFERPTQVPHSQFRGRPTMKLLGLSIYLNHNATNNQIIFRNCSFKENVAVGGGGIFVAFHDPATGNTFQASDSTFEGNYLFNAVLTAGGAIRIGHYVFHSVNLSNGINISNCNFTGNVASYDGGISISPAPQPSDKSIAIFFYIWVYLCY